MRASLSFGIFVVGSALAAYGQPSCTTGLCLQQVSCPAGQTTSLSGVVYAPNGIDPLPNVLVFVPNAPLAPFTPGVSCPAPGTPPSGSPIVGATTAVDGSFTIANVPVGSNIPLVVQVGRWRREVTIPGTVACANTAFSTRMPKNHTEGDIPFFAIASGSADQVECVLRKVGVDDAEFTDPGGGGRINLFLSTGAPGAQVDAATPSADSLLGSQTALNQYDVLMLPCEGRESPKPSAELANLVGFANGGGRVYSSHFSYVWMNHNPPFDKVAYWDVNQPELADGVATIDTTFSDGQTLAQWLQLISATATEGQIPLSTVRHDMNGVVAPTQSWMTLNDPAHGNPVMQFVFDTPVGSAANQCGRILFNEYHVENSNIKSVTTFPAECLQNGTTPPMTPQEKLLEFSLFELTNDGAPATLTPTAQDFGTQPIGFASATQNFTWTNNSIFPSAVTLLTASGDFSVLGSNCSSVAAGASCQIQVSFEPAGVGARVGTLTVGSAGTTLTAALTGNGVPDFAVSTAALTFGSQDVGASQSQTFTVTNTASGAATVPLLQLTGDFRASDNCGAELAGGASCTVQVTFTPTGTGPRSGTLNGGAASYPAATMVLSGNGVDYSLADSPAAGSVIAGDPMTTMLTATPIAGFSAPIRLSCTTTAAGASCSAAAGSLALSGKASTQVTMLTTSKYTVIGYGGFGGGWLWLIALGSGWSVWRVRKTVGSRASVVLMLGVLALGSMAVTGCSDKQPALNPVYTAPGSYGFTVTATDGFLVRSATYTLAVRAN